MAIRVASLLAVLAMAAGTIGVLFFGALGLWVAVILVGSAIMALDGEVDQQTRKMGGLDGLGWAPTCPGCGLDIAGSESFCPHCGRGLKTAKP